MLNTTTGQPFSVYFFNNGCANKDRPNPNLKIDPDPDPIP